MDIYTINVKSLLIPILLFWPTYTGASTGLSHEQKILNTEHYLNCVWGLEDLGLSYSSYLVAQNNL